MPGNKKILIFDDDEDILTVCGYLFESAGYEVFKFTDCNDVIERTTLIRPDAILMDNWIPGGGGIAATRLLKSTAATGSIPVIYFSANSNIKSLAEEAGADNYVAKPFEVDYMKKMVANVIIQGVK